MGKIALKNYDTYVYIDVSNIRAACLKTLGRRVNFMKLMDYFRAKCPNLREMRYYEGIAQGDTKKEKAFGLLQQKGYIVCSLERKSYTSVETREHVVRCPKCKHRWKTKFKKEHIAMKSNVDVYLATEFLTVAHQAQGLTHLVLVACDGDYAEMIQNAINSNDNLVVSVLATPSTRVFAKNTLSIRLKTLYAKLKDKCGRYHLDNIMNIDCFDCG